MQNLSNVEPVDYLLIGNVTQDLTPTGPKLGGTASYSAITARALGLKVGVVTSCENGLKLPEMEGIQVVMHTAPHSTTFENIYTPAGRIQYLHHTAHRLNYDMVPEKWRNAPIVHIGPIADEADPALAGQFPNSLVCLTLQGWLRGWDGEKRVHYQNWVDAPQALRLADIAILSIEDVEHNEVRIEEFHSAARLLVVTEGRAGSRLYWNGDQRRFRPPQMDEVDPVGAGDIFAAAFFFRYHRTRDPWEAARFATSLAAYSVTRKGLQGIPTRTEIDTCLVDIVQKA